MEPKIAERIASNLARVKRVHGQQVAAKWWESRFGHMAASDHRQVVEVLQRRAGQPQKDPA